MQRRLALSLIMLGAALVFLVVALVIRSGKSTSTTKSAQTRLASGAHHHNRHAAAATNASGTLVRNATPQPGWRPYTGPVPILVYHQLGDPPPGDTIPGLYVSDADFQAQMAWLHQNGYQAVTLDEMMGAWFHGGRLPAKPIVITFDNGYIPQATFAPSVMSTYGWPGVLNEITANHLNNTRLESLVRIGWEIDSHSINHPDLTTAPPDQLRYQLVASRQFLQRTFGIPVNSFCYPSSKYNATVVAAVKAAGYTNAVTEHSGYATKADPYALNRFEIERGEGIGVLATDLRH